MVENGSKLIYPKLPDDGVDPSIANKLLEEKDPINQNRNSTNGIVIYNVLIFVLIVWLAVDIYAFCFIVLPGYYETSNNEGSNFTKFFKQRIFHEFFFTIDDMMTRSVLVIPSFMFFTAGLIFLYTLLLKGIMAKIFVCTAIMCTVLSVITYFLIVISNMFSIIPTLYSESKMKLEITRCYLTNIVIATFQILYQLTILHCAVKVKVNYVADVIKKSCKAIFHYHCLIIFSSALVVLHFLVLYCIVDAYVILQRYSGVAIYHCINIILGSYILLFITFFGQTVIARSIATWYRTTNTEETPKSVLLKNITLTTTYDIGTIAFGATVILPILQAIYMSFKVKINEADKFDGTIIRFFTKINLIFKIVDCALIQTAIHGHNFSEATKTSFYLVMRNSSRYLAVTEAFTFIFYLITIIMYVIVGSITDLLIQPTYIQHNSYTFKPDFTRPWLTFYIALIMVFPYFYLLLTAVKTILLCTFNDVLENDESRKKLDIMNVQVHKMPIK